jgi:C-terminal processing protease CtpA/Prc
MLSDSVAYVGISTFNMNDLEFDELTDFMKSISESGCPYLIVDVRNNPGGDATKFFSYIAKKPFRIFEYTKVNKQDHYEFLQYCLNYTPDIVSYPDFVQVEGKSGFFSFNNELNDPDTSVNYKGRVYILTNERSYSASSDLAALMVKYNRGAVVGRETGSGFYQMNARESPQLRLPNSWIVVQFPLVKFVFESKINERIPWGRGVLPDFPVPFTLEEITFENGDAILNYALQLIQDGVYIDETPAPEDNDTNKNSWVKYLCIGLIVGLVAILYLVFHRN